MDIQPAHEKIVRDILEKYLPSRSKVYIFGSRATKAKKEFSDLDLAISCENILSISLLSSLSEAFSESDLPYKVDIVDLHNISETFHQAIEAGSLLFFEK